MTAAQINAGIAAALSGGQRRYVVPAGVHELEAPIVIPGGTTGFELRGEGSGVTLRASAAGMSDRHAIEIACSEIVPPKFGLQNVADRATHLARADSGAWTPGEYLVSDSATVPTQSATVKYYRWLLAEVVDSAGRMRHRSPREFDASPKAASLAGIACRNIRVTGFKLAAGASGQVCRGLLRARFVRGLRLANLEVEAAGWGIGGVTAIGIDACADVDVSHCTIAGVGWTNQTGVGYGIQINQGTRFARVRNCTVSECRQGIMCSDGATDVLIRDCVCTHSAQPGVARCAIDTHGNDERRITIRDCTAPILSLGNREWLGGVRGVRVYGGTYWWMAVRPAARNILARDATIQRFYLDDLIDAARPATDIEWDRVVLRGGFRALAGSGTLHLGRVTLRRLSGSTGGWSVVYAAWTGTASTIRLIDCPPVGTAWNTPVVNMASGAHRLEVSGTTAPAASSTLVERGANWSGTAVIGPGNSHLGGNPLVTGVTGVVEWA